MDWKNIKTIFIFSFLILNLYLGTEFYNKVNPDLDILNEETQRKLNDIINYDKTLPKNNNDLFIISATAKDFSEEDVKAFMKKNSNQEVTIESTAGSEKEIILNANLKDAYGINPDSGITKQLEQFVKGYIPEADQYTYWKYDSERNIYIFSQQQSKVPFYFESGISEENLTGMIEIIVNSEEDGDTKITGYRMTNMVLKKEGGVKEPLTAEEALLAPDIPPNTDLEGIKLVYFTMNNNEGFKVFMPNWYIITELNEWMVDVNEANPVKLEPEEESEVE